MLRFTALERARAERDVGCSTIALMWCASHDSMHSALCPLGGLCSALVDWSGVVVETDGSDSTP